MLLGEFMLQTNIFVSFISGQDSSRAVPNGRVVYAFLIVVILTI